MSILPSTGHFEICTNYHETTPDTAIYSYIIFGAVYY